MLDLDDCRELLKEHDIELSDESLEALRLQLHAIAIYVLDGLSEEPAGDTSYRTGRDSP